MATFIVKQSHFEFGRFQQIALPVRLKVTKSIEQRRDHSRCTDGLADDHVSWLSMQSGLGNNADRAKVMRVLQAAGSRAASPLGGAGFQVTSAVRTSADVSSKSSCSSDVPIGDNSAALRHLIG